MNELNKYKSNNQITEKRQSLLQKRKLSEWVDSNDRDYIPEIPSDDVLDLGDELYGIKVRSNSSPIFYFFF